MRSGTAIRLRELSIPFLTTLLALLVENLGCGLVGQGLGPGGEAAHPARGANLFDHYFTAVPHIQ